MGWGEACVASHSARVAGVLVGGQRTCASAAVPMSAPLRARVCVCVF